MRGEQRKSMHWAFLPASMLLVMCMQDLHTAKRTRPEGASGRNGGAGFASGAVAGTGLPGSGGATAGESGAPSEAGQPNDSGDAGARSAAGTAGSAPDGDTSAGASGAGGSNDEDGGGKGGSTSVGQGGTGGKTATVGGKTSTEDVEEAAGSAGASAIHWVGTWTASPYYDSGNQPPSSLTNSVLRQVVHVSLGGTKFRVQFSNLSGSGPVTINAAHVALCKASPAVDSTIDATTDTALAFGASPSVTIAKGAEVWSDAVALTVPALGNVSITTAFGSVPASVVGHSGSRTTSYLQTASSTVNAASMTSALQTQHWYYISGMDVEADAEAVGAVAIGDSITDGRGTDTDRNNRWTDVLAARLSMNPATAKVSMMNQGIGATSLVGSAGTAAQARFDRDVLGQSGVRYAIVLDGVNDIGGGVSAQAMKNAYADLITRAHAANVLIYGGTITPFYGNSYYTVAHETVRQDVNTFIRSGAFDGYIDFDAAVTNGATPPQLLEAYAAWSQKDYLHPGPAGYLQLGNAADLTLFTR